MMGTDIYGKYGRTRIKEGGKEINVEKHNNQKRKKEGEKGEEDWGGEEEVKEECGEKEEERKREREDKEETKRDHREVKEVRGDE